MKTTFLMLGAALALGVAAAPANAQGVPKSPILDMGSVGAMRGAVEQRYQAALAATAAVVGSNDNRYTWASEAKISCGIAIGYLKSGTVDADSINKCDDYSRRMTIVYTPPERPPVVVVQEPPACTVRLPVSIYFDWNVDTAPADAQSTVSQTAAQMAACGMSGLTLTGHADRSGSDEYNLALSDRRARNIADLFAAAGIAPGSISVSARGESAPAIETADGVREPMNRRVEVNSSSRNN